MIIYNQTKENEKQLRLLAPIPSTPETPNINLMVAILQQQNERINILYEEVSDLREKVQLLK